MITAIRLEATTSIVAILCAFASALVDISWVKFGLAGCGLLGAVVAAMARSHIKLYPKQIKSSRS